MRGVALWLAIGGGVPLSAAEEDLVASPSTLESLACESKHRVGSWGALEVADLEIGRIYFQVGDIFDPEQPSENRRSFRLVNKLHRDTRPWAIEEQLLFTTGDPLDLRVIEETERRLRSLDFLFDAVIVPVCRVGGKVDLLVITRDVWTLGVKVSFQREGGENTFQAGLSDENFFGTGRPVSLLYISDPDRDTYQLRYFDPSLFGRHREFRLKIEERSDGYRQTLGLGQPFYSLDARRSLTSHLVNDRRTERLYAAGEVFQEFDHRNQRAQVRMGISRGLRQGWVRRWSFGYTYEDDRFADLPMSEPQPLPEARTLSYPWVEIQWLEDDYVETQNLDRIGRTEDLNLGVYAGVRVGASLSALGGDRDRAIVESWFGNSWEPTAKQLVRFASGLNGRWGDAGAENVLTSLRVAYYWRNLGRLQLFSALGLDAGWEMDGERQFLLGGDTGLRGYARNFQAGDRRALLSLEQRFYSDIEVADLVNVGAAVFFDVGSAWYADDSQARRVLSNVGFGLRLSSSRSAQGGMVHLDVALPLDGDTDGVQFLIRSRETF